MRTRSLRVSDDVERLLVVGDLHGYVEPLKTLDRVFGAYPDRVQVVAAGDYVVSGAKPAEAVEWVRRNAGEFAVTGNHDQGALAGADGKHPPFTEPGAFLRLSAEQRAYLSDLPDVLELSWKGRCIRVNHGRTRSGAWASWMGKTDEVFALFADPSVALTIVAHTHCPFVRKDATGCVANCGSTSCLILGHKRDDGTIQSKTEIPFEPVSKIYSTYLSVTMDGSGLGVRVECFDYDRRKELECLEDIGDPNIERTRALLETGVY